jgi:ankyrin repeat protein
MTPNQPKESALSLVEWLNAAEDGDTEMLARWLAQGMAVDRGNKSGVRALMRSAKAGCGGAVELLLDAGAQINAGDNDGVTALMSAASMGQAEVVKILIERGAKLNVVTCKGENDSALTFAVVTRAGDCAGTLRALLDAGADFNICSRGQMTLLMLCVLHSNIETAKTLCEYGVDIEAHHPARGTALTLAAGMGEVEIVKILLEAGASQAPVPIYENGNAMMLIVMGMDPGPTIQTSPREMAMMAKHPNHKEVIALLDAFEEAKTLEQQVPGSHKATSFSKPRL